MTSPASATSPSVLALLEPFVKGWPEYDDDRCGVFPLAEVLRGKYDTDVHFTAYTASVERRHTGGSLTRADEAGVRMVAAVFDVDGPEHVASDEWWAGELEERVEPLLHTRMGGFAYRTRGGYRLVFALPCPVHIETPADAERWTRAYLAWCEYLDAEYGIKADRRCKEWQRLYRAPHATRDGVLLDLEIIGSPDNLGCWDIDPDEWAWAADDVIAEAPEKNPKNSDSLSSPAIASTRTRRDAAAAMLGAAWPTKGRHGAQLALAGALCRDGWREEDALEFLCAVCRAAGNEERPKREKTIRDTYKAHAQGRLTTGWSALKGHVDGVVLDAVRSALDPNADGFREFEQLINKPAPEFPKPAAQEADAASTDELGVQWGGWDKPQAPPVYLLEGLIPEAKVVTFFAEGGSVKTWSALSLAIAVATGEPWLGTYPVKKGRALFLDYEDGSYEFHRRVRYLTGGRDIPDLGYRYGGPQIDSLEYWVSLAEYVQKHGITLVIFDSVSAAMPGDADENSSAFAQGVKYAGRFTETGCTVIFIHHANKSGGIRGHGAVRDQSDVVFKFVPVSETDNVKRMRMECDKPGPQKRPLPVNVELTDAGLFTFKDEVNEMERNVLTAEQLEEAIYLRIATRGPIARISDIYGEIKGNKKRFDDALKGLVKAGKVVKLEKGYVADDDEKRRARVLEQLDSPIVFLTQGELARHAFVPPLLIDRMRLEGVICQSGEKRWMRVR